MPYDTVKSVKIGVITSLVIVGLLTLLLAVSFSYLDFYEYGFKRQRSTAKVFTDRLYSGGRYLQGPDFDFKVYPASANSIELKRLTVFSKDALEVYIDVELQYFLRPHQLRILHQHYQLTYNSVIRSSSMDALKASAVEFTTEQFIKDRNTVEKAMMEAVRSRISGRCCEMNCAVDVCVEDCIPVKNCTQESDMGMMVTMRYFYLTGVEVPYRVYSRYLRALVLVEESQMDRYKLEEAVVKKEVDEAVKSIGNEAREVAENATAQAKLITKRAEAESKKIVGVALSEGLAGALTNCGISNEAQKMSFHYLDTLRVQSSAHIAVDFNNFVVGGK